MCIEKDLLWPHMIELPLLMLQGICVMMLVQLTRELFGDWLSALIASDTPGLLMMSTTPGLLFLTYIIELRRWQRRVS